MMAAVVSSIKAAEAIIAVVDSSDSPEDALAMFQPGSNWTGPPMAVLLNKCDLLGAEQVRWRWRLLAQRRLLRWWRGAGLRLGRAGGRAPPARLLAGQLARLACNPLQPLALLPTPPHAPPPRRAD